MKSFRLVFLDDDKKAFSVSLPMIDDTKANKSTDEMQKSGRKVRIVSVDSNDDINEVEKYYKSLGYELNKEATW